MERVTHTQGPWHQSEAEPSLVYGGASREAAPLAPLIARAEWGGMTFSEEEIAANARLIAAAPDLLACCVAMLDLHDCGGWGAPPGEYLPALRAAIEKAGGAR